MSIMKIVWIFAVWMFLAGTAQKGKQSSISTRSRFILLRPATCVLDQAQKMSAQQYSPLLGLRGGGVVSDEEEPMAMINRAINRCEGASRALRREKARGDDAWMKV